jgi:hypothetical protein
MLFYTYQAKIFKSTLGKALKLQCGVSEKSQNANLIKWILQGAQIPVALCLTDMLRHKTIVKAEHKFYFSLFLYASCTFELQWEQQLCLRCNFQLLCSWPWS